MRKNLSQLAAGRVSLRALNNIMFAASQLITPGQQDGLNGFYNTSIRGHNLTHRMVSDRNRSLAVLSTNNLRLE